MITGKMLAANKMRPEIILTGKMTESQLSSVLRRYMLVEEAIELFLKGEITWQDYLDVIEFVDLSVERYIKELEHRNNNPLPFAY